MRKSMFIGASNLIFEKAKDLRNNPTHAETLLWGYLKQNPLSHKFRRQHPISIYVADFYCHSLKLTVMFIVIMMYPVMMQSGKKILKQMELCFLGLQTMRLKRN